MKYTNCLIYLKDVEKITEKGLDDVIIFTEYKNTSLLGVSNSNIYIISPINVIKTHYKNNENVQFNSTNIIPLNNETFALICLKEVLIQVYDINGTLKTFVDYPDSQDDKKYSPYIGVQCGITYQNHTFYIAIPDNRTNNIQFTYFIFNEDSNSDNLIKSVEIPLEESIIDGKLTDLHIFIYNLNESSIVLFPYYNEVKGDTSIKYHKINLTNNERYNNNSEIENKKIKGSLIKNNKIFLYGYLSISELFIESLVINNEDEIKNKTIKVSKIYQNALFGGIFNDSCFYVYITGGGTLYVYLVNFDDLTEKKIEEEKFLPKPNDLFYLKQFWNNNRIYVLAKHGKESFNWKIGMVLPKCKNSVKYYHKKEEYIITLDDLAEVKNLNVNIQILFKKVEGMTIKNIEDNKNSVLNNIIFSLNNNVYHFSTNFSLYFNSLDIVEDDYDQCEIKFQICDNSCINCSDYSESEDKKCLSCNINDNYYPLEDYKSNCISKTSEIEGYFFSNEDSKFIKCINNCKKCDNKTNCIECKDNYVLSSKKTCEKCNDRSVWYFESNIINCINSESCPDSLPYFNKDTLECVNDCNIFDDNPACIKCENDQKQIYNECIKEENNLEEENLEEEKIKEKTIVFTEKYPSNNPKATHIDLGECENILKEKYQISELVIKITETNEGKLTNKVNYNIYDKKGNKLDKSICNDIPITFSYLLTNTEKLNLEEGKKLSKIGIDIYDKNDEYFHNFCLNTDIGIGTDIIVKDRQTDIFVEAEFCNDGCKYKGIDFKTNRVECECNNNNDEKKDNNKRKSTIMELIDDNFNYKIVICYEYILNRNSYKNNWGFLFCLIIFFCCLICTFLHYRKTSKILKTKIYSYISLPKQYNKNNNLKPNPQKRKKKEEKTKKEKININRKKNIKLSNQEIIYNKNIYSTPRTMKSKENQNSTERQLNSKKTVKPKIIVEEDIDYEEMNYFNAIYEDKRSILSITYASFLSKVEIIKILFLSKKFDILYISISSFLFGIIVDFTINAFLFSDVIISQKYKSGNNKLRFITSESLSILSDILGNIFCFFLFQLINFHIALEILQKEIKINYKIVKKFVKCERIIKIRLFIYFFLQFLFLCFFMYYIIIFCSLYKYSQLALFKNYLFGVITHIIYSLVISLVISILRFISLKYKNIKIFLFSQYLNNLF
jgi:hypothetical protein